MKYISTTYAGCQYIKPGKKYRVLPKNSFGMLSIKTYAEIIDEEGELVCCHLPSCSHLGGNAWEVHDDDQ